MVICLNCGAETNNRKFCSLSCVASYSNKAGMGSRGTANWKAKCIEKAEKQKIEGKECSTCKKTLPISEFYKRKQGTRTNSTCKECYNEKERRKYEANKEPYKARYRNRWTEIRIWITKLKSNLCCSQCGENHTAVLDFHHKDENEKEYNISSMIHRHCSIELIKKEISKCIVLCSNCHRKLHSKETYLEDRDITGQLELPFD